MWGIGVDADQGYLGEHVLTSALKKVDVAVFQTIQAVAGRHASPAARTPSSTSRPAAVGLGEIASDVPAELVSQVHAVQDDIAAGKITEHPRDRRRLGRVDEVVRP